MQISIGYPVHNFLLLVDTTSKYSWLRGTNCTFCSNTENIYDEENSISAIHQEEIGYTTMNDIKGSVSGNIVLDDIKINDFYITKVELLIASEDEFLEFADGVLSLKYPNNNDLISKLLQSGYIKKKILYFDIKDEMTGNLMIGQIPNYIYNDKSKYSICHIRNDINNNWNCVVSHILFDGSYNFYNAVSLDVIVNFSTGITRIYAPLTQIQLFFENYFMKLPNYDEKVCNIKKLTGMQEIFCLKSFLNFEGPPIVFIINGYAYQIPFEDLFEDVYTDSYNRFKLFKVIFVQTPKNEWYFGTVFLKQYETIFDAENNIIGFYGGNKFDFTKFTNEDYEKFCWYNSISVCILFGVVLIPMIYNVYKTTTEKKYLLELAKMNM